MENKIKLIDPEINWRTIEMIKRGEMDIKILSIDEILKRYNLTDKEIEELNKYKNENRKTH